MCVRNSTIVFLHLLLGLQLGCASITYPIKGVPAECVPEGLRGDAKRDFVPIDPTQLSQPRPEAYRLAPGDVLSIYVPGVIPYQNPQTAPQLPPIYFPAPGSDLRPSVGLPVVIEDSGKITLLAVEPMLVTGMTVEEVAIAIRDKYLEEEVLRDEDVYPVVSLLRPRTYRVTVIREDTGVISPLGSDHSARGEMVDLPAYENDVLGALMATGGLPGLAAKNEIRIYRAARRGMIGSATVRLATKDSLIVGHDDGVLPYDVDPLSFQNADLVIPLRVRHGTQLELTPESITLESGDTVCIANRTKEVFYTAGLLPGGEYLLPRDYDIDVFAAMAIAGYSYGRSQSNVGGISQSSGVIPSELFIFRQRPDGNQVIIEVDLAEAVCNERERMLVQPGDKLLLRYSCKEELLNFGIFSFFTFGVRQLLN